MILLKVFFWLLLIVFFPVLLVFLSKIELRADFAASHRKSVGESLLQYATEGDFPFDGEISVSARAAFGLIKASYDSRGKSVIRLAGLPLKVEGSLLDKVKEAPSSRTSDRREDEDRAKINVPDRRVLKRIWLTLKEMGGAFRLDGNLAVKVGLAEPGSTGILLGDFYALKGILGLKWIDIRPDFTGPVFSPKGWVGLEIYLPKLAVAALRCLFSKEIRPF